MKHTVTADKETVEQMQMDENIDIKRARRVPLDFANSSYQVVFEVNCSD